MMNDSNSVARINELEEKIRKLEEKVKVLEEWKESVEGGKLLKVESAEVDQQLKADMEFYTRLHWIGKMCNYMFSEEFRQQFLPIGSFRPRCYMTALERHGTIIRDLELIPELNPEDDDFEIKITA